MRGGDIDAVHSVSVNGMVVGGIGGTVAVTIGVRVIVATAHRRRQVMFGAECAVRDER